MNITSEQLESIIDQAWQEDVDYQLQHPEVRQAVDLALAGLDAGRLRVAEPITEPTTESPETTWRVHSWLKKAVLLSFRLYPLRVQTGAPDDTQWFDRCPPKFQGWDHDRFRRSGIRAVPSCVVRYGSYVAPRVVLMPSFINIGAWVDQDTMIDTWATVGSCAQIGRRVHISGGVGIGGVLEPPQAHPVIIEDDCFIGARSEVAEGVRIGQGSVLSMGVYLGASTKIIDRNTGQTHYGYVPPYSVVVPGSLSSPSRQPPASNRIEGLSTYCAVIVKRVDAQTRAKTTINGLLREAL